MANVKINILGLDGAELDTVRENGYIPVSVPGKTYKVAIDGVARGGVTPDDLSSAIQGEAELREAADDSLAGLIDGINDLIPIDATTGNKLTDKAYVDNSMNQVAAKYLSQDEDGNPFDTYELFEAAQESGDFYYAGTVTSPTKNDYVLVSSDSQHDNKVTRYWYTGSSWSFQYVVNNTPFTDAEWDAIKSGITAEKVAEFENKLDVVSHDDTISGDGTEENPLSVNEMVGASEETSVKIGGRVYPVVKIGNQLWITENLDYKFSGVDIAPSDSPETPAAWYYDNDEATYGVNGNKYGLLYNWHAVKHLEDNKETLLPEGWHVPSSAEFDALATAVGGASVAGTALKSNSGWNSGSGTDDFGFSVFPAGHRSFDSFDKVGSSASFWTATEDSSSIAYYRYFYTGASMDSYGNNKTYSAYSVRLVKDATSSGRDGKKGLVPQPKAEDIHKVLSGAGTWVGLPSKTSDLENDSRFASLPKSTTTDQLLVNDGEWKDLIIIGKDDIDALDWDTRPTVRIGANDYPYVQIGNLLWTAKNLYEPFGTRDVNYKPITIYGGEVLPDDRGFIYTMSTMTSILNSLVLPEGWRIPSNNDYETLKPVGGNALRTLSGWNNLNQMVPTDSFGFSLYPGSDFEYAVLISSNKRASDGAYYGVRVWSGGNTISGPTIYNQTTFSAIRLCKDA